MNRNNLMILVLILSISIVSHPSLAQPNCNLKLEKDSIKVYTCDIKGSKFRAVRSVFQLNGHLSAFVAAVLDIDHYKQWQYKTLSATLLKKVSEREVIYYTEVIAPVLTANRDFVIQLTVHQNPETKEVVVDLVSLPKYIPEKKNIVRVPYSKARYTVKPASKHKLQVEYYIEIDLGGDVPPWLVNMVAHQAPYETFRNLKLQMGNYRNARVPFIHD